MNLRPRRPERRALTKLRHTPTGLFLLCMCNLSYYTEKPPPYPAGRHGYALGVPGGLPSGLRLARNLARVMDSRQNIVVERSSACPCSSVDRAGDS